MGGSNSLIALYGTRAVTEGVFAVVLILIIIIGLVIWYKIARNMAQIAADKGYTERKWFHYCFWLGFIGFLMVCAMPDKNRR